MHAIHEAGVLPLLSAPLNASMAGDLQRVQRQAGQLSFAEAAQASILAGTRCNPPKGSAAL